MSLERCRSNWTTELWAAVQPSGKLSARRTLGPAFAARTISSCALAPASWALIVLFGVSKQPAYRRGNGRESRRIPGMSCGTRRRYSS
jgi:hypothetical protein